MEEQRTRSTTVRVRIALDVICVHSFLGGSAELKVVCAGHPLPLRLCHHARFTRAADRAARSRSGGRSQCRKHTPVSTTTVPGPGSSRSRHGTTARRAP